tara:strand:- start:689 stop:1216 length:528 start_codon:yes stop_codon:yes gene_type:complete
MKKKTINTEEPTFIQAINISRDWCIEWEKDLLSEEVLADRIYELIKTKNGMRGFFAYALSNNECTLLDKLPNSLIYKLRERGEILVEIILKNLIMSSAQIINHRKNKNIEYAEISNHISNRCIDLLKILDTKLVTTKVNELISGLDNMGNSFDPTIKYSEEQKDFIREKIQEIAH